MIKQVAVVTDCPQAVIYRKYALRFDRWGDDHNSLVHAGQYYKKAVYYHDQADAANKLWEESHAY